MPTPFHIKFRSLVRRRGLSLLQVSKRLELAYSSVHKWYSGGARPTDRHLPALAELLKVPLEVLADDQQNLPDARDCSTLGERIFAIVDAWGFLDVHVMNWANKGRAEAREEGRPVTTQTLKRWRQGNLDPSPGELNGVLELLRISKNEVLPQSDSSEGPGRGRSVSAGIPRTDKDVDRRLMARLFARAMIDREYVTDPDALEVLERIAKDPMEDYRIARSSSYKLKRDLSDQLPPPTAP